MPYNEKLAARLRIALEGVPNVEEKAMFSGLTFMVNDKMCISVSGMDRIMCRINPALYDELIERNGCEATVMGGRTMKGFIYVYEDVLKTKKALDYWVGLCLDFNKYAKASKKKK